MEIFICNGIDQKVRQLCNAPKFVTLRKLFLCISQFLICLKQLGIPALPSPKKDKNMPKIITRKFFSAHAIMSYLLPMVIVRIKWDHVYKFPNMLSGTSKH